MPKSVIAFAWMFELTAELTSPEHMLFAVVLPLRLPMVGLLTPTAKAVARAMARAKVVLA